MSFDFGTMTCDYDNDRFNQGLKLQHPRGNGHSHCKSPVVSRPICKLILLIYLLLQM